MARTRKAAKSALEWRVVEIEPGVPVHVNVGPDVSEEEAVRIAREERAKAAAAKAAKAAKEAPQEEVTPPVVPLAPVQAQKPQARRTFNRAGDAPTMRLVAVECPLYPADEAAGLPALVVWFRVDNLYEVVNAPIEADRTLLLKRLRATVKRFEGWVFETELGTAIPAPDPQNLESYGVLLDLSSGASDLCGWCLNEGYVEALNRSLPPNSSRG